MKTIAHVYGRYSAARLDLHNELLKSGRYDSVIIAERYIPNSLPPHKNTYYLSRLPSGGIFQKLDGIISRNALYQGSLTGYYARMLKEHDAAVVHAHYGMAGAGVLDAAKKLGLPLVTTLYGVDGSYCLRDGYWIPRFKKLFEYASRIVVLCDEVKNRLVSFGCKEEKIRIWNCLEDVGFYAYSKRPASRPVRFIIAARFVEKKGYPLLLEAFARFVKEHQDARLTMIGYGDGKKDILRMCDRLGIKDRIEIISTDNNPDFPMLYKDNLSQSHIFVLPSIAAKNGDDEGGPALTLIAAQASGLPVITTRFPGSERSVIDGVTGIYCEPEAGSIYEKMKYLYERPGMWDELGRSASDFVKKEFRVRDQVAKMEAIYGELVREDVKQELCR